MRGSEAEWAERVRSWRASGQSAAEYAQALGYSEATLRWWASRLRRRPPGPASVRLARVVAVPSRTPDWMLVRVGSATIEVPHGFDHSLLRELVDVLGEPR